MNEWAAISHYHESSKHHFHRYAQGPGGLDWDNQPNPFRRYAGAPFTQLELPPPDEEYARQPATFTPASIARLFFDSLSISAWKQAGFSRWALRVNPSSGNLHPTEAYLISPGIAEWNEGSAIYHYAPDEHGLELRARLPQNAWPTLTRDFPAGTFFVGITSIYWRESWKYGERAFRYCNHDVGHALAALSIAANRLGWRTRLLNGVSTLALAHFLNLPQEELTGAEYPDALVAISPEPLAYSTFNEESLKLQEPLIWLGKPNALSAEVVPWPELAAVARTVHHAPVVMDQAEASTHIWQPLSYSRTLLRQRRSAVSMDGATQLSAPYFFAILQALMPNRSPFEILPWQPRVHLVLFVHRVEGLTPGMYFLDRRGEVWPQFQKALRPEFEWQTVPGCPDDLPLRRLISAPCEEAAGAICCHQAIASDGCFCMAMLAEFESSLSQFGPAVYPRLFWECGFIGQLLYLEAERAGVRGTGIGCFFDDALHQVIGLPDRSLQSLYHFTLGGPVEDTRITTLPAYDRTPVNG